MPRRRKKKSNSTDTLINLTWQALVALCTAIALAVVAYYRWAAKIVNPKRRMTAQLVPVGVAMIVVVAGALSAPVEETQSGYAYEPRPRLENTEEATTETEPVNEPEVKSDSEPEIEVKVIEETEPYVEPEPVYMYVEPEPVDTGTAYVSGTCGDLKARGLGPFYRGDANYTSKRDRDKDGVACE